MPKFAAALTINNPITGSTKSRVIMMLISVNGFTLDDFKPAVRLPPSKRVMQGIVPFLKRVKV